MGAERGAQRWVPVQGSLGQGPRGHPGWAPKGRTGSEIDPEAGNTDCRKLQLPRSRTHCVKEFPKEGGGGDGAKEGGGERGKGPCLAFVVIGGFEDGLGPGMPEDWPPR